jgi:regulator of chromosome condensation
MASQKRKPTSSPDDSKSSASASSQKRRKLSLSLSTPPALSNTIVLSFGSGDIAQLGHGPEHQEVKKPMTVAALEKSNTVTIASGGMHNVAITSSGELLSWGCNDDGALGRTTDEWVPAPVDNLNETPISVACGDTHTTVLTDQGTVYHCGTYKDSSGVVGFDMNGTRTQPTLTQLTDGGIDKVFIVKIAVGENHNLALSDSGKVYEWGDVRLGQRQNRRNRVNKLVPRLVHFAKLGRGRKIVDIFAHGYSSFARTDDDRVFAWGLNNFGQLGTGARDNLVVPTVVKNLSGRGITVLSGSLHHTLALTGKHELLAFGRGAYGRLGLGDEKDRAAPTVVPVEFKQDGDYFVSIAGGAGHSAAITAQGHLYTWGYGDLLQLGHGNYNDQLTPKVVWTKEIAGFQRFVVQASCGGQHTIVLTRPRGDDEQLTLNR